MKFLFLVLMSSSLVIAPHKKFLFWLVDDSNKKVDTVGVAYYHIVDTDTTIMFQYFKVGVKPSEITQENIFRKMRLP